ncbi:glycerol-3-phosphate ABC transporter permease [Mangrovactinospora gilvigrisea]|uniref:Glycerol-3-phosphate ABC transporter permease n=1 Tax=Mangrovactinospora gilvigrisea TaxID=1428644 RepID=A0A1J7C7R9_9ACTN|nr:sugar ABC transporter permease [Mangrovactinospora gilvigrisea]OIV37584.1 glycerol-3-phosphate ABC transporter permease [Mangrovactinospora gilvigrisea]
MSTAPPPAVPVPAEPAAASRGPSGLRRRRRREYQLFLAFIAPNFVFLLLFAYWPVVYSAYLSLTRWDMVSPVKRFVGLDNYADLLTDPDFLGVLWTTLLFVVGVVAGSLIIGIATSLLLNQRLRARNAVRTAVFAPYVVTGAAVGTLWLFIFDPNYGLLKPLMGAVGLNAPAMMTDSHWALIGLIVVYLWKNTGFVAVIYLAGLQGLPRELYEAAELDGAGPWTRFRRLTLPLLSPVTFFVLVTMVIQTFQAFDIIAVMTGGGPANATSILSWFIYQQGFQTFDAGRAAGGAIIMFAVLLTITGLQARFLERRVHYR